MYTNEGVSIDGDGRIIVRFKNHFGKLLWKTLLFFNQEEGRAEYRTKDGVIPVGKIEEFSGVKLLIIPIPIR
jgi:hypothetical protein